MFRRMFSSRLGSERNSDDWVRATQLAKPGFTFVLSTLDCGMPRKKERLTVTVDPEILEAGYEAVTAGRAESLSAWVNRALAERVAKERRLSALADAIALYEAEFGEITEEEVVRQARGDRASATVIRGSAAAASGKRRSRPA
jgi:hypothetical protein